MTILVTGATGNLGALTINHLLARDVKPSEIIAAGRDASKLAAFTERGVGTAVADYGDAESLDAALVGVSTLVLVSGSAIGERVAQHSNVIAAAGRAGVTHIIYTSAPFADTSELLLAPDHKATEKLLVDSGITFTILRNNWYNENYVSTLGQVAQSGVYLTSTAEGRVASAARSDYAEAIAVVASTEGHDNTTYELSGDIAWSVDDFAQDLEELLAKPVDVSNVSSEAHAEALSAAGLPADAIGFVVGLDAGIRAGFLGTVTGDLSTLIGRPTTVLKETLSQHLSA